MASVKSRLLTATFIIINFTLLHLYYVYNITRSYNDFIIDEQVFEDIDFSPESSCLNKIYDKIFIISSPSRNKTLSISIYQLMQENIDFMVWQAHSSNNNYSMDLWHGFKQFIDESNHPKIYKNEPEKQHNSAYYNKMIFFQRRTQLDIIEYSKISNFNKILILEDDITISNTKWINIFCKSQQYIPKWLILRLGQDEQTALERKKQLRQIQIEGENSSVQYYKASVDSLGAFAISISKPMFKHILDLFEGKRELQVPLYVIFRRKYFTPTKPSKFFVIHPPLFVPDRSIDENKTQYEYILTRTIDENKTRIYFSKYWNLRYSTSIPYVPPINDFEILVRNCPCHSYLTPKNEYRKEMFTPTKPKLVLQTYQMLYDIDKIFIQNNITYWIEYGTLLGAVRHKGMIPWDDDADIVVIKNEFYKKLQSEQFIHDLSNHGYYIIPFHAVHHRMFYTNSTIFNVRNVLMPYIDILGMTFDGKKYNYTYSNNVWYKHEIYPLKRYVFGDIELFGPHYPYSYFNRIYGNNWNKTKSGRHIGETILDIEDEEWQCAKPIGPIQKW